MDCNEVLEQLADYLDEEARAELCREIEEHLKGCHDCQLEVDTIKKTIVLYQADDRSRRIEVPIHVSRKLEKALADAYREGTGTGPSD
ncbi:MAG: zf-HC2 domain-containing protein [Candidatus Eisenbacteria bacterium]|nr:zf-HC2 domain-containing protein [Candidatus Eisenbacteria bacterium]